MARADELPDWERLLAAERHVQSLIPEAVLVGGTAAALHADHRKPLDGDHVVADPRQRFDEVLADLEQVAGWKTERIQKPVLILGALDGVLTGIRQLRRSAPLETEEIQGIRVPTLPEMARIKGMTGPTWRAEVVILRGCWRRRYWRKNERHRAIARTLEPIVARFAERRDFGSAVRPR